MGAADRVSLAVVGAGRMGRVHLRAIEASASVELGAVVEPLAAAREAAAAAYAAPVYESIERFLEAPRADGVLIAAPSDQHAPLVATFAAAGMPVLCEKPLGVRVEDAMEASHAAADAGVVLQVGYWRRFVPSLHQLRERIAAGQLGEIYQLACMQWDQEPPPDTFRAHSGGIAADMGVHEFDQIRWLLGQEVDWLRAVPAGSPEGDPADPDAATVLAQLSAGASATVSLGRRFPHADSCWLEVWGSGGYERLAFMWDTDGERVFHEAAVAQVEAFARAVRGDAREGAGGQDAIAALAVAERVAESLTVATGRDSEVTS